MDDSVSKIITRYFSAVCSSPFSFKGKTYEPKKLQVSPLIFRGTTCPAGCGACCHKYTMDYLPFEVLPDSQFVKERDVVFNDKHYRVFSDMQLENDTTYCRYLRKDDGRCGIHLQRGFSCDFELIRFFEQRKSDHNRVSTQLYGRGWNMTRPVDGQKGAVCEIIPTNPETKADSVRKLGRLKEWCDYFELPNKVQLILDWANSDECDKFLLI